jgi:hypothetical protein
MKRLCKNYIKNCRKPKRRLKKQWGLSGRTLRRKLEESKKQATLFGYPAKAECYKASDKFISISE